MYHRRPLIITLALGISLLSHTCLATAFYFCGQTFQDSTNPTPIPSLVEHFVFFPIGELIQTLPFLPGGVGLAEAGYAGLYKITGFSENTGMNVALIYRALLWGWGLISYCVFLSTKDSLFMKGGHMITPRNGLIRRQVSKFALVLVLPVFILTGCGRQTTTPDQPAPTNSLDGGHEFDGVLDGVSDGEVYGWAMDQHQPNSSIQVDIYDGNTLLATVAADQFRQDLLEAGKGNGKHAFGFRLPERLLDGKVHTIAVKCAGTSVELGGSPMTVTLMSP
jgi:hypothetical protein